MRRAFAFLVRNWPLKLAAIVLATLLYGGLILSQSSRTVDVNLAIEALDQSAGLVILSDLGVVRSIRYFASGDVGPRLDASSFRATVDLADANPAGGRVSLAVRVEAIDPRIQVLDFEPRRVIVQLDAVIARSVPVQVDRGTIPAGLDVRDPVLSVTQVTVRGPESVVRRVAAAEARVRIDPSGLDVNRDVQLIPVDAFGQPLSPIDVEPQTVRVKIAVFTDRQTRSLPVNPVVTGTPASGWEVAAVSVNPAVLTVEGDANQLQPLAMLDTAPISITGVSSSVTARVGLDLPDGVLALGDGQVTVVVTLREVAETRTFAAGIVLVGAQSDLRYDLGTDRVLLTFGGTAVALDGIPASQLVVRLDVTGLGPGTEALAYTLQLPPGTTLVAGSPDKVTVTIVSLASPAPNATAGP